MHATSRTSRRSPIGVLAVLLMVLVGCLCSAVAPATAGRGVTAISTGGSDLGRIAYSGRVGGRQISGNSYRMRDTARAWHS